MKKLFVTIIISISIFLAFSTYALSTRSIENLIICASKNSVCEYYLTHFRIDENDIDELQNRGGLSFLIAIQNKSLRDQLIPLFVKKGLSVNKGNHIDGIGAPPVEIAVVNNDVKLTALLFSLGAEYKTLDPTRTLSNLNESLIIENINEDRGEMTTLLSELNIN